MTLRESKPFLKFAGAVLGLAVFGLALKLGCGRRNTPIESVCEALPMDRINQA